MSTKYLIYLAGIATYPILLHSMEWLSGAHGYELSLAAQLAINESGILLVLSDSAFIPFVTQGEAFTLTQSLTQWFTQMNWIATNAYINDGTYVIEVQEYIRSPYRLGTIFDILNELPAENWEIDEPLSGRSDIKQAGR